MEFEKINYYSIKSQEQICSMDSIVLSLVLCAISAFSARYGYCTGTLQISLNSKAEKSKN